MKCNEPAGGAQGIPIASQANGGGPHSGPAVDTYTPEMFSCRLSVKMFDCTPADLPADLREQLISWMTHRPAGRPTLRNFSGFMRFISTILI